MGFHEFCLLRRRLTLDDGPFVRADGFDIIPSQIRALGPPVVDKYSISSALASRELLAALRYCEIVGAFGRTKIGCAPSMPREGDFRFNRLSQDHFS